MDRALEDYVPYKKHLQKLTKFTNSQPRRDDEDQICTVDEHYRHEVLDLGFNVVNGVRRLSVEGLRIVHRERVRRELRDEW